MRTILIAGVISSTLLLCGSVRAGEPNAEVAKTIQEIAARRAAKEEARVKQVEARGQGEARERAWSGAGGSFNPAPGAPIRLQVK